MSEYPLEPLGNICEINPDTLTEASDPTRRYRYIDLSSIKEQKADLSITPLPFAVLPSRARRRVAFNDVLLGTVRPNLKNFAIIESEDNDLLCSTGFAVLRSKKNISDPRFIFHVINSEIATRQLNALVTGSNYPAVNATQVAELLIPVPPLPEQKKIAEILSGIDNMLHLTLQQLSRITKLRQRISRSYFEGDQFRQHQSHEFTMGELAHGRHGIVDGPFGSNLKTEHYKESGIPVIQSGFVTSGKFVAENYKYVDQAKYEEQIRSSVSGGDLVMAKIGTNAGRSALIPFGHPTGILAGNCLKITPNENLITKEYLAELMNYYYFSGRLADITNTTAQPAVSMSQLKKLSAFIPAIADQKKICSSLHSLDAVASYWEDKHLKIILIKKALCSDLLSGRKRVTI